MQSKAVCLLVALAVLGAAGRSAPTGGQQPGGRPEGGRHPETPAGLLAALYRHYRQCAGSASCLKLKLIASLDRAARSTDLSLLEGVKLVKVAGDEQERPPLTEAQIEQSLPRSIGDKDQALDNLIQDKAAQFVNTHSIQVKLSDLDLFGSGVEEGRGKKKRTLTTLLLMWLVMVSTLVPLKLGTLAILAGKALIISKLALVLAGILGLRRLFSPGFDQDAAYQVVQVPHHGHRRNIEASDLAYRAYTAGQTHS